MKKTLSKKSRDTVRLRRQKSETSCLYSVLKKVIFIFSVLLAFSTHSALLVFVACYALLLFAAHYAGPWCLQCILCILPFWHLRRILRILRFWHLLMSCWHSAL
jgi:hypothetical protein